MTTLSPRRLDASGDSHRFRNGFRFNHPEVWVNVFQVSLVGLGDW